MTAHDRKRWHRVKQVLEGALDLPAAERQPFVEHACEDDALRDEVQALLEAHEAADRFLERPPDLPSEFCQTRTELVETAEGDQPSFGQPVRGSRVPGYHIIRELGSGGMGSVYEALDEKMNRRVALKLLAGHLTPSASAGRRFEQEAWISGTLDHPHLVKVFDRGRVGDVLYFSMELVEGGSMRDVIDNLERDGRDPVWGFEFGTREHVTWVVQRIIEATRGLHYAHERGVIHRDVKPVNLLLSKVHGHVRVADFGVARADEVTRLTSSGAIIGTLTHMAPEQLLGKTDEIGRECDVYGLGVTLFELLTLKLPYRGKQQETYIQSALTDEPSSIGKLNPRAGGDLETVVRKALEKRPEDRYPTASLLADDLQAVLDLRPIQARRSGYHRRTIKWARRKPVHAVLAATLALTVPAVSGLAYRSVVLDRSVRKAEVDRQLQSLWERVLEAERRALYPDVTQATTEILELRPDDTDALARRARAWVDCAVRATGDERREYGENGLSDVRRLMELLPDTWWPKKQYALMLRLLGRTAEADRFDERADRERPERLTDQDLYYQAKWDLAEGNFAAVLELLEPLVRRRADWDAPIGVLAQAYKALRRYDDAVFALEMLRRLRPNDFVATYDLARVHTDRGEFEQADDYLEVAREVAPSKPFVYEARADNSIKWGERLRDHGDAELALDRFQLAERASRQALEMRDNLPLSFLNLGYSLVLQSRLPGMRDETRLREAVSAYEQGLAVFVARSLETTGPYARLLENYSDVLVELGQLDRAIEICRELTELYPDSSIGFYNLAGAHALGGRPDEALAALERAFGLGDDDHEYLRDDRWFASLRDDPRFRDLLHRMEAAREKRLTP